MTETKQFPTPRALNMCAFLSLAFSFSSPFQATITSGDGEAEDVGDADGGGDLY